jgi:DNA polymerase-3 subunit gamma/tau
MSYQALARKWRPRRFSELVGQEHVVRALTHALDSGRLHHAFLFTGTRGVGKTTIARIFAKSLNCEKGPTSNPCGECSACAEIDAGRFVDLLEIDAASNTGVDNVRDLIENAMYAPTRGRYKVYLIDEVHMLSKPAFNALLKILEEPPQHVKFLLATTDPQKLLVTVLSRCIKFNLKRLTPEQISGQMRHILGAEQVAFDDEGIEVLARAADVRAMLGTIERGRVFALLEAVHAGDGAALIGEIDRLAEFSPDFAGVLDEIAGVLHRIQLKQMISGYAVPDEGDEAGIDALAAALSPEAAQLYYQIAIAGRRDLPLAPTPRAGFDMALLRMLAFRPVLAGEPAERPQRAGNATAEAAKSASSGRRAREAGSAPPSPARTPAPAPAVSTPIGTTPAAPVAPMARPSLNDWPGMIEAAGLKGPVGQLALHANLLGIENGVMRLSLKPMHEHFNSPLLASMLEQKLGAALGQPLKLRFEANGSGEETPAEAAARAQDARRRAAADSLARDPAVQNLLRDFGGRLVNESIRPDAADSHPGDGTPP